MKIPSRNRSRVGATLAAGCLVVLSAAGCDIGAGSPSAAHSATPGAAGSGPKLLKGSTLRSLLLPASEMPSGFRLNEEDARNSGDAVSPASSAPVAASEMCGILRQTAWIRVTGVGGATFAQNDYGNVAHTDQVAQEIDTFHGQDAQKAMTELRKAFTHCKRFTERSNGMVAKITLVGSRLHGVGDEGLKAVQTSPTYEGGMTLAAVRVGNAIVTTFYSSSHQDKGKAAVTMAEKIAKNVQNAS